MPNPKPHGSGKILEPAQAQGVTPAQYVKAMIERYGIQGASHEIRCSVEALRYWLKKTESAK